MNTSVSYHGITAIEVKRDPIRNDPSCRDFDTIVVTGRASDGSIVTVTFFTDPGAIPKVAEVE